MVDDYVLNKVLNKIKEILGIETFDDTLKISVIKDGNKSHLQLFLEHALYDELLHGIQQDGAIGACQKMRKKKSIHFLLMKNSINLVSF